MLNSFNYTIKSAVDLFYSLQPADNGVPNNRDWRIPATRIGAIAAPLITLYKPFSKPISIGLGGLRVVTHLSGCLQAIKQMEGRKFVAEAGQSGLAAVSLANFYFQSRVFGFITTSTDVLQGLYTTSCHYQEQKFSLVIEDLLQIAGASCYMALLVYPSSTAVLSIIAAQALLSLFKTHKAWKESKTPEAFVNFIVASFRFYEGKQEWDLIQKQDESDTSFKKQPDKPQKNREEESPKEQQHLPGSADQKERDSLMEVKKEENPQKSSQSFSPPSFKKSHRDTLQQNISEKQSRNSAVFTLLRLLPRGTLKPLLDHPKLEPTRTLFRLGLNVFVRKDEPVDPRLHLVINALDSRRINQRLLSFPLQNFQSVNENAVILEDAEGNQYSLGAHYHGFGKGLVKGGNLCFKDKTLEGKELIELDFKINPVFRNKMQKSISLLINRDTKSQMNVLSKLLGSPIKKISVEEGFFEMGGFKGRKASQIIFNGVGSILVGNDPEEVGLYNRVIVRIPKDCTIFELNKILSFVGFEDTFKRFNSADLERLKMGYLFRHFSPGLATYFERSPEFFKLPIPQLKAAIIEQDPDMKALFETYMPRFKLYEILPGRIRYGIEGVSKRCYELGARSLISSVTINLHNEKAGFNRLESILKMGMLSTEMRLGNDINSIGMSPDSDLRAGSADSVFTQLVTVNDYENNQTPALGKFDYFDPESSIALEFDLGILDRMTYQYHYDSFGTRKFEDGRDSIYAQRPTIYDFVSEEIGSYNRDNEVMVKDRIPPSFIKGILIAKHELREHLEHHLRETGLIQTRPDGVETIFDVPVRQFIRIPSDANTAINHPSFL